MVRPVSYVSRFRWCSANGDVERSMMPACHAVMLSRYGILAGGSFPIIESVCLTPAPPEDDTDTSLPQVSTARTLGSTGLVFDGQLEQPRMDCEKFHWQMHHTAGCRWYSTAELGIRLIFGPGLCCVTASDSELSMFRLTAAAPCISCRNKSNKAGRGPAGGVIHCGKGESAPPRLRLYGYVHLC
ncbi:hypothetical protein LZ32DRAFT_132465 [Colletotrichum eremochloae]|nr:hypothetical protein LZ32DRAFT_132465 [Colletotrichum eremochloae]